MNYLGFFKSTSLIKIIIVINQKSYASEIARKVNMAYCNVLNALKILEKEGIITRKKFGKNDSKKGITNFAPKTKNGARGNNIILTEKGEELKKRFIELKRLLENGQ